MQGEKNRPAGSDNIHGSIRETVELSGYEYVSSELTREDGRPVLQVFIDTLGGLNISDCENVSRRIGKMLDEGSFRLPEKYFLQVSSPGVERPLFSLSDFQRFSGSKARIRLKDPVDEKKTMTGIIVSAENDLILLKEEESGMLEISYGNVLKANLVFSMPGSGKPGKKEKNKRRQQ